MITTRKRCRICGCESLSPVLSLGEQRLASNFAISADFPPVERPLPLDLVRCDPARNEAACGLVQLAQTVPGDLMYASYGYRSGLNEAMVKHLGDLAHDLERRVALGAGDLVIDIGANDGTMISAYETKGAVYVGFEPSNIEPEKPLPHVRFIRDYFSASALHARMPGAKAKIITSIAMFYDLDDPSSFVADAAKLLADDGLWVIELSYLPSMLEQSSFDTICHEHLEYYSLTVLERLFARHGLVVADAELNDANGGSIRVWVSKHGSPHAERTHGVKMRLYGLKKRECEMMLDRSEPYDAFARRIEDIRVKLPALLSSLRAKGAKVYGYGASTKGNVTLQYCGLTTEHLTGIADRNPAKVGSLTPGSRIPIVSEAEMREARPDYLLLLPWHFEKAFRRREEEFIQRGGKFIVPMPRVEILP